jgi:hypothetical protein
VLTEARENAALFERTAGRDTSHLPQTERGAGVYDYRSECDPPSPSERTELLQQLYDAIQCK